MTLAGLQGQRLLFRPGVMLQAAAAHFTAEALMNIPRMLGSLELLLNPTGLLTSVCAGLEDLLGLPFAALVDASPAQVPCKALPHCHAPHVLAVAGVRCLMPMTASSCLASVVETLLVNCSVM